MANDRLTRDMQNAMLGGVCSGIARHYQYDVTVVRVAWLLLTALSAGLGIVLYIATWVIMPRGDDTQAPARAADLGDEVLSVGERITESARVVARATREATEEIAEIARGRPAPSQSGGTADADPTVSAERRAAAAAASDATPEEDGDQPVSIEQEQERTGPVDEPPPGQPGPSERRREDGEPPWGAPA